MTTEPARTVAIPAVSTEAHAPADKTVVKMAANLSKISAVPGTGTVIPVLLVVEMITANQMAASAAKIARAVTKVRSPNMHCAKRTLQAFLVFKADESLASSRITLCYLERPPRLLQRPDLQRVRLI